MKILQIKTEKTGLVFEIGDALNVQYYNIVNDEEDKENPVKKTIIIEGFEPIDDGSGIRIVGDDGERYYESNIVTHGN